MGGRDSKQFEFFIETCCKAYLILRKNAHVFISLFMMMLSTGMPELQSADDINWLRKAFSLHLTDEQASEEMRYGYCVVLLNSSHHRDP